MCVQPPCVQLHALTSVCILNPKHWQPRHCLDTRKKYCTHWQEWVALLLQLLYLTQVKRPKFHMRGNEVLKKNNKKKLKKLSRCVEMVSQQTFTQPWQRTQLHPMWGILENNEKQHSTPIQKRLFTKFKPGERTKPYLEKKLVCVCVCVQNISTPWLQSLRKTRSWASSAAVCKEVRQLHRTVREHL